MALPKTAASLTSLPTELLLLISQDMTYSDIESFWHTSRHFSAALPKPSNAQLFEAKGSAKSHGQTLITCGGCLRLLPHVRFSTKILIRRKTRMPVPYNSEERGSMSSLTNLFGEAAAEAGAARQREQFCNKCGSRPLPGAYRYQKGEVWDIENGLWFLRCQKCGLCEQTSGVPLDEKRQRQREGELCRRCFKLERKKRSPGEGGSYPSPRKEPAVPPVLPVPSMRAVTQ